MVARVHTVSFQGIEVQARGRAGADIRVACPPLPSSGLPDKAVAESRGSVSRAALHALGLSLPPKRLTVNLAPADLMKEGSHFDLPIALGLLAAMGVIPKDELAGLCLVLGELSLDAVESGSVSGVLPAAMHAKLE
jgi:magnesium chelatase family protein